MLESLISEIFERNRWTWSMRDGKAIVPTQEDIEITLDEVARQLYNEEVGTRLEVGGLIVEKRPRGHDVYIMVGSYE